MLSGNGVIQVMEMRSNAAHTKVWCFVLLSPPSNCLKTHKKEGRVWARLAVSTCWIEHFQTTALREINLENASHPGCCEFPGVAGLLYADGWGAKGCGSGEGWVSSRGEASSQESIRSEDAFEGFFLRYRGGCAPAPKSRGWEGRGGGAWG